MGDRGRLEEVARRALRLELWSHQLDAACSDRFITVVAKARRTGGTVMAEAAAVDAALSSRGCRVLVLSATQDAARRMTESVGARLRSSPLASVRAAVVDDFATRIRLANGSEIISLPASPRQVRGYGEGVRLVILDEAGFMEGALWTAAHYTALDERSRGSRILMLGTPWGSSDHFFRRHFERGRDGDPDVASFHWTAAVNPRLDAAYLERQRDRVSPIEYAAEVLGEWSDAAGALFDRALLDSVTADVELPAFAALAGPARPIVGLDWGVSFDRSAAAVVHRLPVGSLNPDRGPAPTFVVTARVWPVRAPLIGDGRRPGVVHEVAASPVPWAFLSPETSGVGAGPSEELQRLIAPRRGRRVWNPVATTNAKKTAGYGAWLGLMERGRVVLPRDPVLLRQLGGLRFEQGERGFTRIGAEDPTVHDDVADALMLAALPYTPRGSRRVVCHVQALADPARAVPDADVDLSGLETVETDGGLLVPRTPPLQSVDGRDVTWPDSPAWGRPARWRSKEELELMEQRAAVRERVLAATTTNNDDDPQEGP